MKKGAISSKKAQQSSVGLSFGMIFAIFLIIVFIIIAFVAIKFFLNFSKTSDVGMFYRNLQDEIDNAWQSQSSSFDFKIDLPSGVIKVCFANLSAKITNQEDYKKIKDYFIYDANVFIIPPEKANGMEWNKLKHINVSKITENQNPYCVKNKEKLKIQKDFYSKYVVIK